MCGIFAYSGPRNVKKVLIEGLKYLEYRGYDSAGVAFFEGNQVHRFRVCGGVNELEKKITTPFKKGFFGYRTYKVGNSWSPFRKKCSSPLRKFHLCCSQWHCWKMKRK